MLPEDMCYYFMQIMSISHNLPFSCWLLTVLLKLGEYTNFEFLLGVKFVAFAVQART